MFMQRGEKFEEELETLDINMTNMANELTEMVIGENHISNLSSFSHINFGGDGIGVDVCSLPTVEQTVCYDQLGSVEELHNAFQTFCQAQQKRILRASNEFKPPLLSPIKKPLRAYDTNSIPNLNRNPVNYQRRASAADAELPMALLSAAAYEEVPRYWHVGPAFNTTGARKKYIREKTPNEECDYDKVVVDLKAIGLNTDSKETNDIVRLFSLLHKVNYYLSDVIPFKLEPVISDEYPAYFDKPTFLLPSTMNIRTQIRHIIYKCNGFCNNMTLKLNEFHSAEREKYTECSRSIFVLRKLMKQLEAFKTAEFEHRYGAFVNSFATAKAKNLELLLTQIISKIRECNIFVEVYRWSIKKNIEETGLPSMQTLQKAVAIAAAISKENSIAHLGGDDGTYGGGGVAALLDVDNNKKKTDNGGGSAGYAVVPEPEIDGVRSALRYLGN